MTDATTTETRLIEARDLYRIPLWFLVKPLYALAPASFHDGAPVTNPRAC